MKTIMTRAWQIRREAAARFGCRVSGVSMAESLRMAWAENKGNKMIEYKSATGKNIKVWIETARENEADHNVMSPCYDFRVEVEGIGRVNVGKCKDGLFSETYPRRLGGKRVLLSIPASAEASALYAEYLKEIDKRIARGNRLEKEYTDHYNNVSRAMSE